MPRNVDHWYTLYGPGRMLVDNDKPLSDEEKAKIAKKMQKRKDKEILEDKTCIRRLMKDIKELAMCAGDFPNVSAAPLEDNIYLWHANVTAPDGRLKGLCVHLELQFPSSYPRNPPKVRVLTPIRHPNIFGSYICLTMLNKRKYNDDPNEGWTGAYTVASILLQLQSFLFEDNIPQDFEDKDGNTATIRNDIQKRTNPSSLACFNCKRCQHTGIRPHPPIGFKLDHDFSDLYAEEKYGLEWDRWQMWCNEHDKTNFVYSKGMRGPAKKEWVEDKISRKRVARAKRKVAPAFPKMGFCDPQSGLVSPLEVLVTFLDPYEILMVAMLYPKAWDAVNSKYNLQEKYESSCFYTKMDYKEAALGYGVRVQYDPFKQKVIRQLSSDLDLISWHAWKKLKCRISAWGNDCDLYIPMVLNKSHLRNSSKLMWTQLRKLAAVSAGDEDHNERILDALCGLMNSMVVGMLKIEGEVRMHHSEKALQGYCRFHQLLLEVCNDRPEIRELAEKKVEDFIKKPRTRHKKGGTPDLGRLLVMLSVSDKYGWEDIKRPFFEEVTVRQQKWNVMGCPTLGFDCDTRSYGTWFRAMKPLDVLSEPHAKAPVAKNPRGQAVRMPTEGTIVYGRKAQNGWVKIDTPCRGYVYNAAFVPSESADSQEIFTLQELPFKTPALCITKRKAAGRFKQSKSSKLIRNIEANTYCVVLDVVGNRALVASVVPGKRQTTALERVQVHARAVKTIYGSILLDVDTVRNGKHRPMQDAFWVSIETKKGKLLEQVDIPDDWRLDECFKHTQVSRELIMFQKAFLDIIKEGKTLDDLSAAYLSKWGNPPKGSLPTLHKQVKGIKASKTWNDYLRYLKLEMLSKEDMIELLKRSVGASLRKRYTHSFHTGYDEIPDRKKHRPTNAKAKSFIVEDLGEDYVSRYARKPRTQQTKRHFDRHSESNSSEDTVFNPLKHKVIKPRQSNGRKIFFKGDLFALFLGGLPKNCLAADVQNYLSSTLPRGSFVRVPRNDEELCRGFAFLDIPSLKDATHLVKNGVVLSEGHKRHPRFARAERV